MKIQELQQQLCDMEAAAEQLRVERSELVSKVEALEVHERQISLWSETKVMHRRFAAVDPLPIHFHTQPNANYFRCF